MENLLAMFRWNGTNSRAGKFIYKYFEIKAVFPAKTFEGFKETTAADAFPCTDVIPLKDHVGAAILRYDIQNGHVLVDSDVMGWHCFP
ncbi:MAG: hypothetical protein ABFD82_20500 [Syntrophaceae bacterium]